MFASKKMDSPGRFDPDGSDLPHRRIALFLEHKHFERTKLIQLLLFLMNSQAILARDLTIVILRSVNRLMVLVLLYNWSERLIPV